MSEDEVYAYFSGPYEGRDAFLALGFLHDRLFAGTVSYPGDPARVVQDYRRAVALLSSIYGRPSAVIENFVPPFASGDGNEASALRENKAAMQTIWKFDDGNDITAFVDRSTMGPTIIFKNTVLMGQYLEGLGRR